MFADTAAHQFRDDADYSIVPSLHHGYGYQTGRATRGGLRYFYADVSDPGSGPRLAGLLRRRDYDVFCLNDHDSSRLDPAEQERVVREFLTGYFPLRSTFERGDGGTDHPPAGSPTLGCGP
ncbi:hypothetical protein GCM10025868_24600 [Angustibacter aerolatus]|uniref:Stealth protein CR4 conserved region 4 domain-containing protein n=1 Tax=Angustibacter aerolatus TaxID=1162965 RepID=A0ABQ6JG84_9ACTN|nr:hypothetical protein GCM10025868_24600 [Angustibacter aerolatus]